MSDLPKFAVAIGALNPRFIHLAIGDLDAQADASVRYVYCSEVEVWSQDEFRHTLASIVRILESGGCLRIVARDLDMLIHNYMLDRSGNPLSRGQQFNAWRQSETAKYLFNEEDLKAELENAGVVDIWRLPAAASSTALFQGCEPPDVPLLILEGRKTAAAS